MTTFNYNYNIPAANNNPSSDQPLMLENYQSINDLVAVDHVGFEVANGGQHKQVTFNATASPSAPTDPISVLYTANDSSTHPNQYFKNSQATFLLSGVKAFGVFTAGAGTGNVTPLNSYNISTTITKPTATRYVITLNSNAVTGNNVIVMITTSSSDFTNYTFSGGVLTINMPSVVAVTINFMILQA